MPEIASEFAKVMCIVKRKQEEELPSKQLAVAVPHHPFTISSHVAGSLTQERCGAKSQLKSWHYAKKLDKYMLCSNDNFLTTAKVCQKKMLPREGVS